MARSHRRRLMSAGRRPYSSIAVSSVSSTNFSADLADPPRYWRAIIRKAASKCSSPHWLGRRSLSLKGTRRTRSSCSTKIPVDSAAIAAILQTARLEFSRQQAGFADERRPVFSRDGRPGRSNQAITFRQFTCPPQSAVGVSDPAPCCFVGSDGQSSRHSLGSLGRRQDHDGRGIRCFHGSHGSCPFQMND